MVNDISAVDFILKALYTWGTKAEVVKVAAIRPIISMVGIIKGKCHSEPVEVSHK